MWYITGYLHTSNLYRVHMPCLLANFLLRINLLSHQCTPKFERHEVDMLLDSKGLPMMITTIVWYTPLLIGSGTFPAKLLSIEIFSISPEDKDTRMDMRNPLFNSNWWRKEKSYNFTHNPLHLKNHPQAMSSGLRGVGALVQTLSVAATLERLLTSLSSVCIQAKWPIRSVCISVFCTSNVPWMGY